jgi:putative flavoprotein involved in K+ transport
VGRAVHAENTLVHFGDNLLEDVAAADLKLLRLLMRVDEHIAERHRTARVPHEEMPGLTDVPDAPASLDLEREGIRTVLWATGFRRSYPWLHVPVVDERGEIRHRDGVTPCPGLYVMGLRFLRTRKSSFIDGQPGDALALADHIQTHRRAPALS